MGFRLVYFLISVTEILMFKANSEDPDSIPHINFEASALGLYCLLRSHVLDEIHLLVSDIEYRTPNIASMNRTEICRPLR